MLGIYPILADLYEAANKADGFVPIIGF